MPFIYTYPVVGVLKRPVVELLDEMDVIKEDIRVLSDNYVDILNLMQILMSIYGLCQQ